MSQIELNSKLTERKIFFEFPFSFIDIKRISFPDLKTISPVPPEIESLVLLFALTGNKNSGYSTFPLHIASKIDLYSNKPEISFEKPVIPFERFIVPAENSGNTMTTDKYVHEVTIKLKNGDAPFPRILIDFNETRGIEYAK